MSEFTSFKVGGPADRLIIVDSVDELRKVLEEIDEKQAKHVFIGNGSNVIFSDEGYRGTVIKAGEELSEIQVLGNKLVCGSACLMSKVARAALEAGLTGFEFASGIPGSIGGAIFMDAGAYGGEMRDIVEAVTVVSGDGKELKTLSVDEMDFGYRTSRLQSTDEIVVSVLLNLEPGNKEEIQAKMKELTQKRNEKQPVQYPSAGSFFKRPEGHFAGKLIDDAGLRGFTVGGAQVSEKHCGFVINKGGATCEEIKHLMVLVQEVVLEKFGVKLEPEVRFID